MEITKQEVQDRVDEGQIHALVTFEVAGKPKDHVEKTLTGFVSEIRKEKNVALVKVHQEEAAELEEEGFFGAFAEAELVLPSFETLTALCFNYSPASIEILSPDMFRLEARDVMNWSNDLLSKLHEIAQQLRVERQKVAYAQKNMQNLLRNMIVVLLASGGKSTSELARLTGAPEEPLGKSIKQMVDDGQISSEDGKWTLSSRAK